VVGLKERLTADAGSRRRSLRSVRTAVDAGLANDVATKVDRVCYDLDEIARAPLIGAPAVEEAP
jgi:hypothetical protein